MGLSCHWSGWYWDHAWDRKCPELWYIVSVGIWKNTTSTSGWNHHVHKQVEYFCQQLREKHHHCKLLLVTTITGTRCKECQPASELVWVGCSNNMQLQPLLYRPAQDQHVWPVALIHLFSHRWQWGPCVDLHFNGISSISMTTFQDFVHALRSVNNGYIWCFCWLASCSKSSEGYTPTDCVQMAHFTTAVTLWCPALLHTDSKWLLTIHASECGEWMIQPCQPRLSPAPCSWRTFFAPNSMFFFFWSQLGSDRSRFCIWPLLIPQPDGWSCIILFNDGPKLQWTDSVCNSHKNGGYGFSQTLEWNSQHSTILDGSRL